MKYLIYFLVIILTVKLNSQNINLNQSDLIDHLRYLDLKGEINLGYSFNQRPLEIGNNGLKIKNNFIDSDILFNNIVSSTNKKSNIKFLPVDFNIEFNSHHPYNRNNGSMIPNKGYQHIISAGIYFDLGPLSIQLKPEHHYADNLEYNGFPENHYSAIWASRYILWNRSDIPERFGKKRHNNTLIGQSNIKLNFKKISIGFSNENIWWGPSRRNSIMMSNNSRGFKHISFNTNRPVKTPLGNFEWQFVTGRLENSGYSPPNIDFEHAGTKLYVPKINQNGEVDDWRFFQGINISFSPKWIDGLSIGYIRWVQMYSALVKGEYTWMTGNPTYFPLFSNLFRKNDVFVDYEEQTDQAAGLYFRWIWKDAKAEIYAEYHYNDAKQNIRDLLLDSEHARGSTIGLQKIFSSKNINEDFIFSWEWTQLEQTGGRLLRDAGSWYMHGSVRDGYTNKGEVIGAGIGPGSNSQFFSIQRINKKNKIGIAFEIIDNDNDFYYRAFDTANDFRRYWKDFNLHLNFNKKFKNFYGSFNFIFSRGLNYQWELDDSVLPYYHSGKDVNNLHLSFKFIYPLIF